MPESTKQPKRRWLRFSLRTFLIVVVFLSAWIGRWVYRAEQQRTAVQWVIKNGGTIRYDYEVDQNGKTIKNSQPPVPKWLLKILDVNYFSSVVIVVLRQNQVTDLTPLAGLRNLEHLSVDVTRVSDLSSLADLKNLKWLVLKGTTVGDLTPLADLKNLERLYLDDTAVSDLTPLAGLTNLKWLDLSHAEVGDLTPLTGLTNLEELWLIQTQVSNEEKYRNCNKRYPIARLATNCQPHARIN